MSKFVNVKVKKSGGGFRMQRAMVLASGKYKFVKNGSGATHRRSKGAGHVASKTKRRKSHSKALVHRRRSHSPARSHRRRGGGGGGGINILHLALAGAAVGYATSAAGPDIIRTTVAKIPGNKTFGAAATVGLVGLGVSHFIRPRGLPGKIAKYAGYVGVLLAAYTAGSKGKDFQWVGDEETGDVYDVGDEDVGDDDDMGDDDIGDEDVGDDSD